MYAYFQHGNNTTLHDFWQLKEKMILFRQYMYGQMLSKMKKDHNLMGKGLMEEVDESMMSFQAFFTCQL